MADAENEAQETPRTWWSEALDWLRSALYFVPLYFVFTTAAFGNYVIPSESMVPALEVGDRVIVSKFAYGYSRYSLPLGIGQVLPASTQRLFAQAPERGDVVVFRHPRTGVTMIKRLVGLPGDTIMVRAGRLIVNGAPVALTASRTRVREAHQAGLESFTQSEETLPNGVRHLIHELPRANALDDFGPITIPAGHYFMMGDNRDNSLDSRWSGMGLVPAENLIGRAETVYFAAPRCNRADCPERQRFLRPFHD
ncbi:MAG: signal peptidase I [Hyphomonadaceae bacterium]